MEPTETSRDHDNLINSWRSASPGNSHGSRSQLSIAIWSSKTEKSS